MNDGNEKVDQGVDIMGLKNLKIRNKILLLALFIIAVFSILILAYIVPTINNIIEERTVAKLNDLVDVPYTQLQHYYDKVQAGEMDEATAQSQAFSLIEAMRYNEVEYYWIHGYDGVMRMHPIATQLNDQLVINLEDENGKLFFQEMIQVVDDNGSGTVEYWWPKPGSEDPQPKMSFVKGFDPWQVTIGTGIYVDDLVALQRTIYTQVITISIVIILVSLVLVTLIVAPLNKTLRGIMSRTHEYQNLDFRNAIDVNQKDELGEIARAFNQVSNGLRGLLETMKNISGKLSLGAQTMNSDMSSLSTSTDKTVMSSEEIAQVIAQTSHAAENVNVTVQEIRQAIEQVADKATEGAMRATDVNSRAVDLKKDAHESSERVSEIYTDMKDRLELAIEHAGSVKQIDELLSSILSLTEQTNLLALNASIEAARAGDAGRGFAVVANEVGSLAEQSKDMVASIQETVDSVKKAVNTLISDSKEILTFMEDQVLVDYEKLNDIGDQYNQDADTFNEIMTELSAISEQLSGSMENISDNIQDVAAASRQGAEGVDKILEMSREVMDKSQQVKELIDDSIHSVESLDGVMQQFQV